MCKITPRTEGTADMGAKTQILQHRPERLGIDQGRVLNRQFDRSETECCDLFQEIDHFRPERRSPKPGAGTKNRGHDGNESVGF